jgi:Fanconi anemia group M protein
LPNIDNTRARRLLGHFHTVDRVFRASKEELMSVSGIGEKISEEIKRVLTTKYEPTAIV